jgi:hypothetical protein
MFSFTWPLKLSSDDLLIALLSSIDLPFVSSNIFAARASGAAETAAKLRFF